MNNKQIMSKLIKAQGKYEGAVGDIEVELIDKILFDFTVIYQDSDGWCILNAYTADLAPVKSCLDIIKKKGVLSVEDFKYECI